MSQATFSLKPEEELYQTQERDIHFASEGLEGNVHYLAKTR